MSTLPPAPNWAKPTASSRRGLVEMRLVLIQEALRTAREGEITDGPSTQALLWCEPLLT